ncbi:AEC family transporter [Rhodobacteraceae bacterium]|nr:AEC family transporter [Paracoccaceae bacterium]
MQAQLDIILPVFIVIGFGYIVCWRGLFSENAVDALVGFTQNFAIPCLLFRAISEIEIGSAFSPDIIITYYLGAFASFFLGYFGARKFFNRSPIDAAAIAFCCFFSNTILLGLPITEQAYGADALKGNFAIIAFHAPLCYFLGVSAMEIARNRSSSFVEMSSRVSNAMFRNPFVIGIALGFFVNITGLPLPGPLSDGIDILAQAALPAALFGLGGILFRYKPEGDTKTILMVCMISLIVHPTIVFATGTALALDQDSLRSAVVTASMAPGVNAYVFANMYGAARRVAASSVLIATAASIVSIWVWLNILP